MKRWDVERAVKGSDLPPPARLLMLTLATYTADGGVTIPDRYMPSLNGLAAATGLSKRTVQTHLDNLDEAGWLIRTKRSKADQLAKHIPTGYELAIPAMAAPAIATSSAMAGAAIAQVQELPQLPAEAVAGVATNQNKNTRTGQTSAGYTDPLAALCVTDDERRALVERLTTLNPSIRNPSAYISTIATNGDLDVHLEAIRAERRTAANAAVVRDCRACDAHGYLLVPGSRSLRVSPYQTCKHTNEARTA